MSRFSASIDLAPSGRSVPAARHLVGDLLRAWAAPHDSHDAALLVTELMANAVDHVGGEATFTLQVTLSGGRLRIAVLDGSSIHPVVRELEHGQSRGRGMRLVAGIADRWGAEDHPGGKRVWFELHPPQV